MGITHNLILGGGASLPTTLNVTVSGGTATTVTATLGSRSVSLAYVPGPSRLPSGYTELEYIESAGTQYIDTGINGTACYGFELVFKPKETTQYESILSGVLDNATFAYYASATTTYFRHRGSEIFINGAVLTDSFNTITLLNNTIKINGTTKANVTTTNAWATSSGNIMLCNNTSLSRYAKLYCKSLILYGQDQTTKLCNFVPARRNSDSVLGMYDLVNNTFHTNAGSGTFVAGPEVVTPGYWTATLPKNATGNWTVTATDGSRTVSDLVAISGPGIWSMELMFGNVPSGYTELEYIESTGTQYINTGFYPISSNIFGGKFAVTRINNTNGIAGGVDVSKGVNIRLINYYYPSDWLSGSFLWYNDTSYGWSRITSADTNVHEFVGYSNKLVFDGTTYNYSTQSPVSSNTNVPALLADGYVRMYRFYAYATDGTTLVRDMYPARRNSDSVLGMWDNVTNTFYTNSGTGTFIAGPEV